MYCPNFGLFIKFAIFHDILCYTVNSVCVFHIAEIIEPNSIAKGHRRGKIMPFLSPQSCTVMLVCFALCNVSLRDVSLVWRPLDRSSLGGRFVSDCSLRGFSYSKPSQQLCFWHERALVYRDGGERGFNPAQYTVFSADVSSLASSCEPWDLFRRFSSLCAELCIIISKQASLFSFPAFCCGQRRFAVIFLPLTLALVGPRACTFLLFIWVMRFAIGETVTLAAWMLCVCSSFC